MVLLGTLKIYRENYDILHIDTLSMLQIHFIGKILVPLGWYPSWFNAPRSRLESDMPNKYPLYKVYMGLIIRGTIPRGTSIFPMSTK